MYALLSAIIASYTALNLSGRVTVAQGRTRTAWRAGGAIIMGVGIWFMHFIAMLAYNLPEPAYNLPMDNFLLGVGIGIATLVILPLALMSCHFDQRIKIETARAEALRQSEERFRSLVQNSSDIIAVFAADGTVCYASPSVKGILGYETENWNSAFELVHPDDLTKAESLLAEAQRYPYVKIAMEYRLQRADGEARDFEVIVINLLSDPGVAGIITTYCDITKLKRAESALQKAYDELEIRVEQRTNELSNALEQPLVELAERKQVEEDLRKSEARNRALLNAIPDLILRVSKDGTYLDLKPSAKDFDMLVPDSEVIGKSEYEVLPPAVAQQRMHYVERALSTGDTQIFEYQLLLNGKIQHREARIVVNGEDEVLVIVRDISDRKQAEEALRESQQMLQCVMDNIPQFIFWKDRNSVYLGCNRNFAQLAGVGSPENIVGKIDYGLPWKKEEANFFRKYDRWVIETDKPEYHVIEPILKANGKQAWLDTNKVPLHDSRGNVVAVLGTFEDITDRMLAEKALCNAHQRLTFHVENSPLAVVEWDCELRMLLWSPQAEKVFGWRATEVFGKHMFDDWSFIYAEDKETVLHDVIEPLMRGREQRNVTSNRNYTKNGSVVYCEWYNSVLLDESGELVSVMAFAMDITDRKRAEEALQKAHDELEIRVDQRTTELRTTNEQLLVEITERKRVEKEIKKLNEDLKYQTVELEAANKELEAFSYSVSHDLRAPLRAINGFSRILLNEYAPRAPEARRYLQMVQDNGQQMGCLVNDLLTFSRLSRSPLKKHPVHPNDLVRQALTNLREEQQGRQVEISISNLPACQADAALLKQVWVNLLANALKFTRQREVGCIEVGCQQIDGKHVYFVKDNGVGFDMHYAHKLFGVFQRLHCAEEYEGTGVGLAIVQRVIHRHGGSVWAEAEVNKGATFYFTIGG